MFSKKRKYTGFDGVAKTRLAGTEKFKDWVVFLNGGKIKNLGTYVVRKMRGKESMSVHATGRAIDLGYGNREDGLSLIDFLVRNADAFGIEYIADYYPPEGGRGWRCDRQSWQSYKKGTIAGAPFGKWVHVELSPEVAKDAGYIDAVFQCLLKPAQ